MPQATIASALAALTRRFHEAGIDSARIDARVVLGHALGLEPLALFNRPERPLSAAEAAAVETLAARRAAREPMSHITGTREFWSLSFRVTPATLDPRPDTETIVEAVLDRLTDRTAKWRLLDFGTGSGCILLALLSELPHATGLGIDASPQALEVAQENAARLGMAQRAEFRLGDWGKGLSERVDAIVSNPPYITLDAIETLEPEVRDFEPRSALVAPENGLACYRAMAPDLARLLKPGGVAVVEVGQGQADSVAAIMSDAKPGFIIRRRTDLAGIERAIVLESPLAGG